MTPKCGICGVAADKPYVNEFVPNGHRVANHVLFERMKASRGVIELLSPLAADIAKAKEEKRR